MGCIVPFIIFILCIPFSLGAIVGFVPNANCTANDVCDFNSPIWNITGVPSAGDDVYIVSDDPIIISVSNSVLVLSSLHTDNTFILNNSILYLTSAKGNALEWTSQFSVLNSSLFVDQIYGANFLAVNSFLNISSLSLLSGNTTFVECTCLGDTWDFNGTPYFLSSFVTIDHVQSYPDMLVHDSQMHFNDVFVIYSYSQVNGSLIIDDYIAYEYMYLMDTFAEISLQIGTGHEFQFQIKNYPATLLWTSGFYGYGLPCSYGGFILGNNVEASVYEGGLCLSIGTNVSLSFQGDVELNGIQHFEPNTRILINSTVNLPVALSLPANVIEMTEYGVLKINNNITINESFLSTGSLNFQPVYAATSSNLFVYGDLVIGKVHVSQNSTITVQSQFNASSLTVDLYFNFFSTFFTVNAPETFITTSGINITGSSIVFNGKFSQIGGYINFSVSDFDDLSTPVITVNGQAQIESVKIFCHISSEVKKVILIRSLTKSLSAKDISYANLLNSDDSIFKFALKDGSLYLERNDPPPKQESFSEFMSRNYWYFIIAGGFLLVPIFIMIARLRFEKPKYAIIN